MTSIEPAVPFIDLKRTMKRIFSEVSIECLSALEQCEFVGGQSVRVLELELAKVLGVQEVVTCANGTDALVITLRAAGLQAGDSVAVPNLTFWATFEAPSILGLRPVLIDCHPVDLQMSFIEFKQAHEKFRFKGAILAHLFGWASADLKQFRNYCREEKIVLIEDGAQSFGVRMDSEPLMTGADIGTLSFYPAKVFGGCADGGAMVFSDPAMAAIARSLANHGRSGHYSHSYVGWNSRMSGFNARYLRVLLKKIDSILGDRRTVFDLYQSALAQTKFDSKIKIFVPPVQFITNGYLSVLQLSNHADSSEIIESLKAKGVLCGRVYPETICQQPAAKSAERISDLQVSRNFCKRVFNPPLFWGITELEIKKVLEAIDHVL